MRDNTPVTERGNADFVEKRVTLRELVRWHPFYEEYFSEKLKSNEASPLCGLPARIRTDVTKEVETGDIIIRYWRAA